MADAREPDLLPPVWYLRTDAPGVAWERKPLIRVELSPAAVQRIVEAVRAVEVDGTETTTEK